MSTQQQQPDGRWAPAQPLGWQEEHTRWQRFVLWLQRYEHCNDNEGQRRCLPWRHEWVLVRRHLTVSAFDLGAKGELWCCSRCPAMDAR